MNRREIKNRIAFRIWTAVTRVEKYNTCAAVQILVTICFISFRDDSFTSGQSNFRRFINERSVTNIRDWSLAYSFICTKSVKTGHREGGSEGAREEVSFRTASTSWNYRQQTQCEKREKCTRILRLAKRFRELQSKSNNLNYCCSEHIARLEG